MLVGLRTWRHCSFGTHSTHSPTPCSLSFSGDFWNDSNCIKRLFDVYFTWFEHLFRLTIYNLVINSNYSNYGWFPRTVLFLKSNIVSIVFFILLFCFSLIKKNNNNSGEVKGPHPAQESVCGCLLVIGAWDSVSTQLFILFKTLNLMHVAGINQIITQKRCLICWSWGKA